MKSRRYIPLIAFLLLCIASPVARLNAQSPADEPEVIILRADPEIIPADGQSSATITAEVRNRQGALVPDGTVVRFTTTAGAIGASFQTRAGIVRANLRSSATEAVAEVSATAGTRAVARIRITFTAEPIAAQQLKPFAKIEAQGLQYFPENGVLDAAGSVRLTYRGYTLTADLAQVDINSLTVKARNNIKLRYGKREITADLIQWNMQSASGTLVALDDATGVRRQSFMGYELQTTDQKDPAAAGTYDFVELEAPRVVMTARKATLFPGDKLQFSRFGLYVASAKVISLPFYVVSLNPYALEGDQFLSFDSVSGVSVNLPFYYSVTDSTNGSIRLRRQGRYSYDSYNTRPGWQLALDQRYNFGQNNSGRVEFNHITEEDWGVRWQHEQQFGPRSHAYLGLDSPTHRELYARNEIYHSMPMGDLSLSTYGSLVPDVPTSIQSRLYFRMRPGTIGKTKVQYYWTGNMAFSQWGGRSYLEEGLDLQVHPPAWRFSKNTSMQFYSGYGYLFSPEGSGPTAQASAALVRQLGRSSNASLRYNHYYSGRSSAFFGSTTSQSVTGQLFTGGSGRLSSSLTATYMIGSDDFSAYGSLVYSPFRNWRLELRPSYTRLGGPVGEGFSRESTNLDVYLARQIGGRDIGLRWSTLDERIRLEVSTTALRF